MYNNLNELMEAENNRRRALKISLIFNCVLVRNQVYGEIKGRNPVKIGYKKAEKFCLFDI